MSTWRLSPDRALPADPAIRPIAREIYQSIADLPLLSMHGHVEAQALAEDQPFGDPAELFVIPDHYLVRMIVSQGGTHSELGVPSSNPEKRPETDHRLIWRRFCENWKLYRGTPTRYWMEHELVEIFGITQRPSAETADAIYDELQEKLQSPDYTILKLFERFNIQILATTDPADSDLRHHRKLHEDGWGERIVPTFRPDQVVYLDGPNWREGIDALSASSGIDVTSYQRYLEALRQRRQYFLQMGTRATDHGHTYADTTPMSDADASAVFDAALAGQVEPSDVHRFAANMLYQFAKMSVEDGLVMQLHPGVTRNHHPGIWADFGADKGFDIPHAVEYTRAIQPLLRDFGHAEGFRLILFTIDEDVYSRELAPIAGAYPTVKLGAPWWFLDSPDGMMRYRELVTETAGFYNTTGFVDDTRAFCSIPARHDLARRIDAGYLGRLVAEHRLDLDEAMEVAHELTYELPLAAYAKRD